MEASLPKRRGRPPKVMAQPTDRLSQLTAREKALALKARARHRYTVDLPLELYEQLLDQAESWDQPLPDVVRAALRRGLEAIKQFGAGDHNPYIQGRLNPPAQHDYDPSGTGWPPTAPTEPPFATPKWDFHTAHVQPAPQRSLAGLIPNGYTSSIRSEHDPAPTHPDIPPFEEPDDTE